MLPYDDIICIMIANFPDYLCVLKVVAADAFFNECHGATYDCPYIQNIYTLTFRSRAYI